MMNLTYHSTESRSILTLNYVVHFPQTQSIQSSLLVNRSSDAALRLLYLYRSHKFNL